MGNICQKSVTNAQVCMCQLLETVKHLKCFEIKMQAEEATRK